MTLSVSEVPFRIVSHPAAIFYEGVPLFDEYDFVSPNPGGMLIQTKEDGDRVATKLGKSMAMLMWAPWLQCRGNKYPGRDPHRHRPSGQRSDPACRRAIRPGKEPDR